MSYLALDISFTDEKLTKCRFIWISLEVRHGRIPLCFLGTYNSLFFSSRIDHISEDGHDYLEDSYH